MNKSLALINIIEKYDPSIIYFPLKKDGIAKYNIVSDGLADDLDYQGKRYKTGSKFPEELFDDIVLSDSEKKRWGDKVDSKIFQNIVDAARDAR